MHFEGIEGGADPATVREAADRAAAALVRGAHGDGDDQLVERVVHLADSEGLETLAALWAGAPADSLAGSLWRLYLLRQWVYADPRTAAEEFDRGRHHVPVSEVVSGVADPPGPGEVQQMVDALLRGVVRGEYADTLFRAAAFAKVAAAGRARREAMSDESSYASDLAASRLLTLAEQLEHAAHLELAGELA
jgi:hypothetical protein